MVLVEQFSKDKMALVLLLEAFTLEGIKIASKAEFQDVDSSKFSQLVVSLTNPVTNNANSNVGDTLSLLIQGSNVVESQNLVATSNANNTVTTITGTASPSTYQEILQNIVFKSHSAPDLITETVDGSEVQIPRKIEIVATDLDQYGNANNNKTTIKLDTNGSQISGTQK